MLDTALHHPRKLWVRKALFQVHLWLGILLSLYVVIISLSGSILVFQEEFRHASLQATVRTTAQRAPLQEVIARAQGSVPGARLTFIGFPQPRTPWWTLSFEGAHGKRQLAYAQADSGIPLEQTRPLFIDLVLDAHVYLLAGQTGFIVNCALGIGLLILALSGAVLWWPGIKLWRRSLTVSLRHKWKRINYDLHNAVGIWTLVIVSWWGLTAIYFLMPAKVAALVNAISPIVAMKPPPTPAKSAGEGVISPDVMVASLPASEAARVSGIALPEKPGDDVILYVERAQSGDFSHQDILTFEGHTGKLLTVWHYGENKTLGDWLLWLMYPLHFGTLWGLGIKIVWALLGLCVSLLSVTGVLMYWNRKLRKLVARL